MGITCTSGHGAKKIRIKYGIIREIRVWISDDCKLRFIEQRITRNVCKQCLHSVQKLLSSRKNTQGTFKERHFL